MERKERIPPKENKIFCMAPWTHTYLSPQTERRLCCASREKHSFVHQYIDQPGEFKEEYRPTTLKQHWNGDFLRSVRRRMLRGERLPECEVCNDQILNLHTYRCYFTETLFPNMIERAYANTDDDGRTSMEPISFDYRLSNACNYKCRMCGEQLSSSWEQEKRKHDCWDPKRDPWMVPETKRKILAFQKDVVEKEFAHAISSGNVEEIYWVGGEPLMWPQHWKYMDQLVREKNAKKVFVRYNTNLSKISWKGTHLFDDLLVHFKDYNICASIDAPGKIGEFIRTGLEWDDWLENFKVGVEHKRGREDSMVMDLTLTLPGLFGVRELFDLARSLEVKMYVKIVFAFDPSIVLSPFALPRAVLDKYLDSLIEYIQPRVEWRTQALLDTLVEMKKRPTFAEQYPDTYKEGFQRGRENMRRLADWRGDGMEGRLRIEDIYRESNEVLAWWTQ